MYYEERKAHHRRRNHALKARRVADAQAYVIDYLLDRRCVDCGESDLLVLEFDHLADKQTEVSTLVRRGVRLGRIRAEIAKCEIVCASCHRRRTARRGRWRRLAANDASTQWRSAREERNARHVYTILTTSGCVECGTRDLVVLDFDHVGAKSARVMRLVRDESSLARIDDEIAQCEVRCANCHRRRTATALGHNRAKYPQRELNSRYVLERDAC